MYAKQFESPESFFLFFFCQILFKPAAIQLKEKKILK